jgi:hypothetical protein
MTIKLTIRFSGLFLYLKKANEAYVLAPRTGKDVMIKGAKYDFEPHEAHMMIYNSYIVGTGAPDPSKYHLEPMGDYSLSLGNGPNVGSGFSSKLPNIDDLAKSKPHNGVLTGTPHPSLHSRVILTSGKQCGSFEGANFFVHDWTPTPLTCEVYWQMEIPDSSLTLNFTYLGGIGSKIIQLKTDQLEMCLSVFYGPRDPGNGPPPRLTPAHHFLALFSLYEDPQHLAVPLYFDGYKKPEGFPASCAACESLSISESARAIFAARGVDPVMCVGGGGG